MGANLDLVTFLGAWHQKSPFAENWLQIFIVWLATAKQNG